MIVKKYNINTDTPPTYKEFCKLFPKAKEAEKYLKASISLAKLSLEYELYDEITLAGISKDGLDIVWNDWYYKDYYEYYEDEDDNLPPEYNQRNYYPVLNWFSDNYHSDLYYCVLDNTWRQIDGDEPAYYYESSGIRWSTVKNYIQYHIYNNYWTHYYNFSVSMANKWSDSIKIKIIKFAKKNNWSEITSDDILLYVNEYYEKGCKLLSLDWGKIKAGGPSILCGQPDVKEYYKNKSLNPPPRNLSNEKSLRERLLSGLKNGAMLGFLAGLVPADYYIKRNQFGKGMMGWGISTGVGALGGMAVAAYQHYKDRKKK